MKVSVVAVLALGFVGGFFAGMWVRKPAPSVVRIEAGPKLERDLSPKGEVGTVKASRVTPGPQRVPVAVPRDLGVQLQTTTAILPALEAGARFQLATFGQVEGERLSLRPVAWLEGVQGGRIPFEVSTTKAPISLPLGGARARWSASLLVVASHDRLEPCALVQRDWGRVRITAGALPSGVLAGVGWTW